MRATFIIMWILLLVGNVILIASLIEYGADLYMLALAAIGLLIVLVALISTLVSTPIGASGKILQQKFIRLGTLKGRTRVEIIAAVGPPSAQSFTHDGGQLLQWMETGYHIALIFDVNGICGGVTHEAAV